MKLPHDWNEARSRLATLGALATATGWERAAIVYAFTYEGDAGRPAKSGQKSPDFGMRKTLTDFAAEGIHGLTTRNAVRAYRDAWKSAIEAGEARDIGPGANVKLPTAPFPPTRTGTDGYDSLEGATKTIDRIVKLNPTAIGEAIKASPKVAAAAAEAFRTGGVDRLAKHELRNLSRAVDTAIAQAYPPDRDRRLPPTEADNEVAYWQRTREALQWLLQVQVKVAAGATPPPDVAIMLQILVPQTDWDDAARELLGDMQ